MEHYMQQPGTGSFESLHCLILSLSRSLFLTPGYSIILFTQKNPATMMGQNVQNEHLTFCFNSNREAVKLLGPKTQHLIQDSTGPNTRKQFLISESS